MHIVWKASLWQSSVLKSVSLRQAKYICLKSRVTRERSAYFEDVAKVARAIMAAFHPDKVNYGAYGDTGHHLHFHLVPKYKDEFEWGGVFEMNPDRKYLEDEEYQAIIAAITAEL